jgi:hypothetical protein
MVHGRSNFPSKGSCIYCGSTGVKLGDEHIVPEALGGQHILKEASCRSCEAITSKFELRVARDLWGDARAAYDAPSKKKRQKRKRQDKKHLEMMDPDGFRSPLVMPFHRYPAAFIFYKMGPAGLLRGLPENADVSIDWTLNAVDDESRRTAFVAEHPDRKLTLRFRHVPDHFGRLLAKIGYGQVLTQLDLGDFRPISLPYILGEKTNISYVVGGSSQDYPPDARYGYSLTTASFGSSNRLMLVVIVRLYANVHSPIYHVVVGDVMGEANVSRVLQKLDGPEEVPPQIAEPDPHWLPQVLPLPFWASTHLNAGLR